ncbi:MAG TPA: MMPL family transporter, partial [Phycisphaerales bacterium]|nr:MMPL family transporter [Phycisphaerales bacterium]
MRNPVSPNRDRFLAAWARAVTARPWLTILFFLIVAALCAAYTAKDLHFKSDRSDLVDPNTPWQKRYADYKAADPRWDDAVVVVDLTSAHAPAPESFIAELESRLRADPAHFKAVTAGFDRESAPPGLIYTASLAQVKDATDSLKRTAPVLASTTFPELLGLSTLAGNKLPPDQRAELAALLTRAATIAQIANEPRASASGTLDSTTTTAQSPSPSASDRPQAASRKPHPAPSLLGLDQLSGTQRLTSSTGKLATILVSLVPSDKGSTQGIANREDSLRALRAILSDLHRDARFTALRAGVTGVPVLESDETVLSRRDASFASAISLTLIALLMLIVYRGVIVPLFAVIALMVGMAMSFAWATLAVGHLQLLSVTFASMLLGLGIDVAIHIIARLELVHPDHDHLRAGFEETYRGVGPGILTASITVAAACGAMAFTPFAGVGELGIIAAGGMVLCTIAVMSLFPALMMVIRKPESRLRAHEGGVSRPFMGRFGVTVHRRPAVVLTVAAIVMAASGWLGTRVRYDPDLLKLMPSTTESVVWQNELERDDARSVWHAIVVAHTPKEALDTTLKLRALPEVAEVGGAGILFQSEADITAKRDLLRSLPDPKLFPPASSPQRTPSVSEGRPQQRTPSGSEG